MSTTLGPTAGQFAALTARPGDAPVLMVNLLKFKRPVAWSPTNGTGGRSPRTSNGSVPPSASPVRHLR